MIASFINHESYRHAWRAMLLSAAAVAAYIWHDPDYPPNGGTWLGYALGAVSLLLILWLMWFGIRKRRYGRGIGQLKGWLSAHVYFGLALLLLVCLHAGFQFGWNLHTLAFALLALEIASGVYGVYAYLRYPRLITDNLNNQTREALLESVDQIDRECLEIADKLGSGAPEAIAHLIRRTTAGGSARAQLWPKIERNTVTGELGDLFDQIKKEERLDKMIEMMKTSSFNVDGLSQPGQQYKTGQMHKLLDLLAQRKQLVDKIKRHVSYKAWLNIWLYVHVPLAFAVLAAVLAHIVAVFIYW